MLGMVVLMILFSLVELLGSFKLSGNSLTAEAIRLRLSLDEFPRRPELLIVNRKDRRAILRTYIRPLPVKLRSVVNLEESLKQFIVAHPIRIERHPNGFRMTG